MCTLKSHREKLISFKRRKTKFCRKLKLSKQVRKLKEKSNHLDSNLKIKLKNQLKIKILQKMNKKQTFTSSHSVEVEF